MRTRIGFALLAGSSVLLALTGCGSEQAASGGDSSPTPSASASASLSAPATPTAKPTPAGPAYMPSDVLRTALLPVSSVPGGTVTGTSVEDPSEGNAAGYSTGLEFVSGDEACRELLDAHPVTVATGAGQDIEWADLSVVQLIESFPTVADAQAVMLQNDNQVKNCHQATVAFDDGEPYPATHELLVADGDGDQMTALVHQLTVKLGSNSNLAVVMNEHRNGGEIMFLDCYPLSSKGITTMNAVMPQATAQFESVVDAYRVGHPRP